MKVQGKDLFTIGSVTGGNAVIKPEVDEAIKVILALMKKHAITKIES